MNGENGYAGALFFALMSLGALLCIFCGDIFACGSEQIGSNRRRRSSAHGNSIPTIAQQSRRGGCSFRPSSDFDERRRPTCSRKFGSDSRAAGRTRQLDGSCRKFFRAKIRAEKKFFQAQFGTGKNFLNTQFGTGKFRAAQREPPNNFKTFAARCTTDKKSIRKRF